MIHGTISREEAVLAFIGAAPGSMLAHDAERIVAAINALPAVQPAPDVGALVEALRDIADSKRLASHGDPVVLRDHARAALAQWEAGK